MTAAKIAKKADGRMRFMLKDFQMKIAIFKDLGFCFRNAGNFLKFTRARSVFGPVSKDRLRPWRPKNIFFFQF